MQDFKTYTFKNKRSGSTLFKRIILAGFVLGVIAFFVLFLMQPSENPTAISAPEATPAPNESSRVTLPLRLPGQAPEEGRILPKPSAKDLPEVMLADASKDITPPPSQAPVPAIQAEPLQPEIHWVAHEIARGDSLSSIFKQFGLSANLLHRIVHSSKQAKTLTRIQPGETLRVALDDEKKFKSLILEHSKGRSLHITATEDGFSAKDESKKVDLLTAKDTVPSQNQAPLTHPEPTSPEFHWSSHEIASGDSLSSIFKQLGLSANLLYRIVHSSKQAKALTRIQPGETLRVALDDEQKFKSLILEHNKIHSLHITATNHGFSAKDETKQVELRTAHVQAGIDNSLYLSAKEAGLPDALIMELANIFGWDIDFALEIRSGDSFTVIYQEEYLEGEKFKNGPILAAEFVNQGRNYRAVRYVDKTGNADYFTPEGRSMRKAFLRAPVDFRRISSRFTKERWHPVLGKKRPHRGVDYAAKTGTPIKAAGDGKIVHRGKKGGYGRTVIIQHGQSYTTLYAHLSKYNKKAKPGKKVKQGQIIGYVGRSGLATGPHLHYEFRLNGVHRNPLTVKLPAAQPIAKKYRSDFTLKTQPLIAQLDTLNRTLIADAR